MTVSLSQSASAKIISHGETTNASVSPILSLNDSIRIEDKNPFLKSNEGAKNWIVQQYKNDMLNIILNDSFEDGFVSQSENYIVNTVNEDNVAFIREAANSLYLDYYGNSQVLTGLLIMVGSLSYEEAMDQGPTMALGLLQHEDYTIRDRAIQAFERWNSKKGIPVLRALKCDRAWLQRYVDKVIAYLERDGID